MYGHVLVSEEIVEHEEKADVVRSILNTILMEPVWVKLWTCLVQKVSFPRLVI